MIDIVRFDHISMAVANMDRQVEILEGLFGFRAAGGRFDNDGFVGLNLDVPGSSNLGWEIVAPNGPDSYLHRFLAGPGPGLHHVTLQVRSVEQAVAAMQQEGAEPWGRSESEGPGPSGVVYLHPRGGGQGFLYQLYEGEPWHEGRPFEDDDPHSLGIIAVNHLSHAHDSRSALGDWYERLFGLDTIYEPQPGEQDAAFVTRVLETPTRQLRFEILQPLGEDSFVRKFLERRGGPAMHHVTFEVGDWGRAVNACVHHGVPTFGERSGETDGAAWREAFIHPRHTGGMLAQFFWQERPGVWI